MGNADSKFSRISVTSVKQQFEDQVVNMILSGDLRPGEKLPTERQLASDMGISKTVVHEGIRDLVNLGFIDNKSHRDCVVADYSLAGNLGTLNTVLQYHQGTLDRRTATGVIDFCEWVECPSLQRICEHKSMYEYRIREQRLNTVKSLRDDREAMGEAWAQYHRQVVFFSGNPLLPLLYSSMMQIGLPVYFEWVDQVGPDVIIQDLMNLNADIEKWDWVQAVAHFRERASDFRTYIKANREKFRKDPWTLDQ